MTGLIIFGFCLLLLLGTLILILNTRIKYKELDKKYGKPYLVKLIHMIGNHPELRQGTMTIALYPKEVIAFNRKVFPLSEIKSIRIISELPENLKNSSMELVEFNEEEHYICIDFRDKHGEHEVIFNLKSNFNEVADLLIKKWKKYLLYN